MAERDIGVKIPIGSTRELNGMVCEIIRSTSATCMVIAKNCEITKLRSDTSFGMSNGMNEMATTMLRTVQRMGRPATDGATNNVFGHGEWAGPRTVRLIS